ncbi:flavin reductase family protein [Agrobacterium larrymoorei]|uniref:Flavin reductase n=1 Tax=Agrobacterium larrymoorei TaxID=160699 RepID=A0A4D7E1C9_9HYPH|nr:flavin reductase family protein [Agrobacterium larrymoorei]QCJ01100.1 flavin reductase [Agrobacterium larrymoorei]QYA10114.1 flavin reductase [Agrobacterium larrymoorei]
MDHLFKEAMARLTGVVTVITTGKDEGRCGLTATAVCSLSANPPSILVCVNGSASAHDSIVENGYFGVNVLAPRQAWIANRFAGMDGRKGVARFDDAVWNQTEGGAPLLEGALISLDCELGSRFDGYSHSILLGNIKSIKLSDVSEESCLLWRGRKYHQSNELATSHA